METTPTILGRPSLYICVRCFDCTGTQNLKETYEKGLADRGLDGKLNIYLQTCLGFCSARNASSFILNDRNAVTFTIVNTTTEVTAYVNYIALCYNHHKLETIPSELEDKVVMLLKEGIFLKRGY
ncbi:MAG: hypothetical protein Q8R37_05595 [Nanoarchaeota archaeon]|nr:hypothetical protein [Nanoarchaeota archaeon]